MANATAPAADSPPAPQQRLLVCGDACGSLAKLFTAAEAQASKVGSFDALMAVGAFLPGPGEKVDDDSASFLSGAKRVPLPTYFVDSSPALIQASPNGRVLCQNLYFLGGFGIRDICGLRVAYLSGRYDPELFENEDADFVGGAFTSRALQGLRRLVAEEDPRRKGLDVLLTCGWPAGIESKILEDALKPIDPDDSRPSWVSACAPALAELCLAVEPRYYLFGTADLFYQRPPFQAPRRGHVCRLIGLGKVGSTGKQRKWLHALSLSPMVSMKREELEKMPVGVTHCPFVPTTRKRPASPVHEEPDAKRQATKETAAEQALRALLSGDAAGFQQLSEGLPEVRTVIRRAQQQAPAAKAAVVQTQATKSSSGSTQAKAATTNGDQQSAKQEAAATDDDDPLKAAAADWLSKPPKKGVVRYTFKDQGQLGLRMSRDVPPWILEVRDGSLAAKKAPRVPVAGVVLAVNGYDLSQKGCEEAMESLKKRPVVLDILWPADQGTPLVNKA